MLWDPEIKLHVVGFSEPCGGPGRGHCARLPNAEEVFRPDDPELKTDDRLNWPHRFFHYACQCEANYMGYMCQECQFGFRGANCDETHTAIRHNVMQMSDAKKEQFRRVVDMSKSHPSDYVVVANVWDVDPITDPKFQEVSVYDLFVYLHHYASRHTVTTHGGEPMTCQTSTPPLDFAHLGPGFLQWHRLYLLLWERTMQIISGEEDFTFPFWDWTDKGEVSSRPTTLSRFRPLILFTGCE
jgi:tyrosinase